MLNNYASRVFNDGAMRRYLPGDTYKQLKKIIDQGRPMEDPALADIVARKIMTMMVVADERICDGLYYARSMRLFRRILENPWMLEERLEEVEKDID